MSNSLADVTGMAEFLAELVSSNTAESSDHSDYPIHVDDGVFAIITPETPAVYLVTVQEAQFVPAGSPPPPEGDRT